MFTHYYGGPVRLRKMIMVRMISIRLIIIIMMLMRMM